MNMLPQQVGFVGDHALREARTSEYSDQINLVTSALASHIGLVNRWDLYVTGFFADQVVIRSTQHADSAGTQMGFVKDRKADGSREARHYAYSYQIADDNTVSFGDPVEVVRDFTPATVTQLTEAWADDTPFIEATATKNEFNVTVIEVGTSLNNIVYSAELLRSNVDLFNTRVFAKSDDEHLAGRGKAFANLHGQLSEAKFVEGAGREGHGAIVAKLTLLGEAEHTAKIAEAVEKNMTDVFGLSIDAIGPATRKGKFLHAQGINKVKSVDIIMDPGAGGRFINFIEAAPEAQPQDNDTMLVAQMLEAIAAKNPTALIGLDQNDHQAVLTAYTEAVGNADTPPPAQSMPVAASVDDQAVQAAVSAQFASYDARRNAERLIEASNLPQQAIEKLNKQLAGMTDVSESVITSMIEGERTYLASFTQTGHVQIPLGGVQHGNSVSGAEMCDKLLDKSDTTVTSLREAYVECTGDKNVTGLVRHCSKTLFREALDSTSFPEVLGDSITRVMIAQYGQRDNLDSWRRIANIVRANDFRTVERTRFGGYGDLPIVAENGEYLAMTSPSDEVARYNVSKRGGTESLTIEMITNDDVGAVQQIPLKLARAAKRTMFKFALDFMRVNPICYDGKNLFHVDHNNLFSAALDESSYAAARLAMKKQAEAGSDEPLGAAPAVLWVPDDLEESAHNMFKRTVNQDETFIQSNKPLIVPVSYWTDANDWCITTNPLDIPLLEIAFLHGQEEPELFIQDAPNQGSMFSNDRATYKLRHIYGGNALDYRGFSKSVVAA